MTWSCNWFIAAIGAATISYIIFNFLYKLCKIIYPYFLAKPLNLLSIAGGRWAVITGASDGIGKAYAFELAHRGFNLLLISRTQSKLDDVRKGIEEETEVEVRTITFDLSTADLEKYQQKILTQLEELDVGILVNNAGMCFDYPDVLHKTPGGLKYMADVLIVNTLPHTLFSAAVLKQMVERNSGIIINVSSVASLHKMTLWAVYSSTKKYISWLTEIVQKEYAKTNIIIQAVYPLLVSTNMYKAERTTLFIPSAEDYVKTAVNTIGIQSHTAGYFLHQLVFDLLSILPEPVAEFILDSRSYRIREERLHKQ